MNQYLTELRAICDRVFTADEEQTVGITAASLPFGYFAGRSAAMSLGHRAIKIKHGIWPKDEALVADILKHGDDEAAQKILNSAKFKAYSKDMLKGGLLEKIAQHSTVPATIGAVAAGAIGDIYTNKKIKEAKTPEEAAKWKEGKAAAAGGIMGATIGGLVPSNLGEVDRAFDKTKSALPPAQTQAAALRAAKFNIPLAAVTGTGVALLTRAGYKAAKEAEDREKERQAKRVATILEKRRAKASRIVMAEPDVKKKEFNPYEGARTAATVAGVAAPVGYLTHVAAKEVHTGLMDLARAKAEIGKEKYRQAADKVTQRSNNRYAKAEYDAAREIQDNAKKSGLNQAVEEFFAPGITAAYNKRVEERHWRKAAQDTADEVSRHRIPAAHVYKRAVVEGMERTSPKGMLIALQTKPSERMDAMLKKIEQSHINKMNKTTLGKITKFLGMVK